jgi:hypothetical protein
MCGRHGGNPVIDRAHREVRPPHLQSRSAKAIEGATAGTLLREMAIDMDQRATAAVIVDHMLVPYPFERVLVIR